MFADTSPSPKPIFFLIETQLLIIVEFIIKLFQLDPVLK